MSEEKEELSYLEKSLVCQIIAEEQGRLSNRLEKVVKKIEAGQKTYMEDIGAGAEDIQDVRNRIRKIKDALFRASKKITCSPIGEKKYE